MRSNKTIENLIGKFNFPSAALSICFLLLTATVTSCMYKFNPGSTGGARNIQIRNFPNESGQGPANMSQLFTERLRSYYQQHTDLAIVNTDADWLLEGRIISYTVAPVAPRPNETVAANRLTITVEVNFVNKMNKAQDFKSTFSFFGDLPPEQSVLNVDGRLIQEISDQIIFDIYTRTTSTW